MARNSKRPGDVTGRRAEILAKEHAEDLAARAQEITLLQAAQAQEDAKPVDLVVATEVNVATEPEPEAAAPAAGVPLVIDTTPVVQTPVVEVAVARKSFRVNTTLENVTIGKDNTFTFEEGRQYTAPKFVYDHLEEKGYIWH